MSASPIPSILRRTTSWFILAATGNVAILGVVFMLNALLAVPAAESLGVVASFAQPMYAPELLVFVSIPGLLTALRVNAASDSERDEAVRLIAWAVRGALTFVLMFAVVIVVVTPQQLATVFFALLLSFVTFVLAERLDPPIPAPIEQRYLKADRDLALREFWADEALGRGWHESTTRSAWAVVALFIVAPVVAQTVLGAIIGSLTWGMDFGLSAKWLFMAGVTAYGPVILTFAWLSMADKADSSQARVWRGSAFAALGAAASIAFASVFLFANERTAPISIMILLVTLVHAAALWAPVDWWGRRLLSRVAATMTSRHLERRTRGYAPVYLAWEEQQTAAEDALSPLQRLFRRRS